MRNGFEWEVGIGTYTSSGTTLSRDTVLSSSAGGTTKVTFSAGTKDVFVTYPAEKSVNLNSSGVLATPTFAAYRETTTTNATVTGTYTVDMSTANIFNITLTGSTTFTFSNPATSGTTSNFLLAITQGGSGSYTATWPASVKWPNASTPTLTTTVGKVDIFNFITFDGGTTYYGSLSLANL